MDGELVERCTELQVRLVDRLADLDDQLAELVLERESLQLVTADEIRAALRRVTLSGVISRELFCLLAQSSSGNVDGRNTLSGPSLTLRCDWTVSQL